MTHLLNHPENLIPWAIVALVLGATWFWLWRKSKQQDPDITDMFSLFDKHK